MRSLRAASLLAALKDFSSIEDLTISREELNLKSLDLAWKPRPVFLKV
jgi:hypothetical protein